jgi:hypothetical protein
MQGVHWRTLDGDEHFRGKRLMGWTGYMADWEECEGWLTAHCVGLFLWNVPRTC